jgi:LmbE family N-acetylglucosaminyl deacetylase
MAPVMLVAVAHPDDETFGCGSVIASAAARGVHVAVCCATRGEAGEDVSGTTRSPAELAAARERELRAAATVLGAAEVDLLGFADSGLDGPAPAGALVAVPLDDVVRPVAALIERLAPDVVVTFDPRSVNDHRDHMRMGEATTIAFAQAAKPSARLYHWTLTRELMVEWIAEMRAQGLLEAYAEMELGAPLERITTIVDVAHVLDVRRKAIAEHRTQLSPFTGITAALERRLLTRDHLIRVVPPWDGGPIETSLFPDG